MGAVDPLPPVITIAGCNTAMKWLVVAGLVVGGALESSSACVELRTIVVDDMVRWRSKQLQRIRQSILDR